MESYHLRNGCMWDAVRERGHVGIDKRKDSNKFEGEEERGGREEYHNMDYGINQSVKLIVDTVYKKENIC